MATLDRIKPAVATILADLKLDLYDIEHAGGVVKVTIDTPGGVDLEQIALATRLISREMDHLDPIAGRYTLEVSSPGLERNLRTPDHFQRIVGWKVNVRTNPNVEGDRRVVGVLAAADDDGITVTITGAKTLDERRLAYHEIERARTVFEWGAANEHAPGAKAVTAKKKPAAKKAAASAESKKPDSKKSESQKPKKSEEATS